MAFASGFGQTYFISLWAGQIRGEIGLSHGEWGGIYTIGTMMSAAVMLWAGTLADTRPTRQVLIWVLVSFAAICVAMSFNQSAFWLIAIIFGLRFCGQGMLSHIAMVAAGRWFAARRGRAVSIIALGFSLGESILPVIFVALAALVGWRESWLIAAAIALLYIPVFALLLRHERKPKGEDVSLEIAGMSGRHWTRREAVGHWLFWAVLPAFAMLPIFSTALFFQQVHLTETKGWSLVSFVALFPLTSLATIGSMLACGSLVDRFGSSKLIPFFLIPMALSFAVFSLGTELWSAGLGFVLLGLSHGVYTTLAGTFWPEFYGTRHLGAIRSVATSVMVFSSAVGPGLTGLLIDQGIIFEDQLIPIAAVSLATLVLATFGVSRANKLLSASA